MTAHALQSGIEDKRWLRISDGCAMATAVSLPWSTSATGIFVAAWIVTLLPALSRASWREVMAPAAAILPVVIIGYALLGVLWSEVAWTTRLAGISPFAKLLVIPLFLFHFQRTDAAANVFLALFVSCCVLLVASWLLVIYPDVPWRVPDHGVPVKDYISQSGFFSLCIVALLDRALALRQTEPRAALVLSLGALIFFVIVVFVATGRTTLVVLAVLLVILGFRHCRGRSLFFFLAGLAVMAGVSWTASPYLRERVTNVSAELQNFRPNEVDTSSGARLAFWRESLALVRQAPLFGHGTGSTREMMSRAASVDAQAPGAPSNPHNQIFAMAIPLGLFGVALLVAMWAVHARVFLVHTRIAWIGLAVVTQNIVGGMFNSHLFDFTQGWLYVIGVGVAGGAVLRQSRAAADEA
jgi:O-antigen ligase